MLCDIKKFFFNHALRLRDFILDLLFPIECANCGNDGAWICQTCLLKIELNSQQSCPGCHAKNSSGAVCKDCAKDFHLNGILVAGTYKDKVLAKLIKEYKYNFCKGIANSLTHFLLLFLRNFNNLAALENSTTPDKDERAALQVLLQDQTGTLLIPVPLHKRRLRWRGFNQAQELAEKLAAHTSFLCDSTALVRTSYNQPQAKLNKAQRRQNLQNRFCCASVSFENKNIILIDDVVTTGTTLNECAKVLKQNGANIIWGLVIAKN